MRQLVFLGMIISTNVSYGCCTSVTALYRYIYGIRLKRKRMGLESSMSKVLNGTDFNYTLRNTDYHIRLIINDYEIQTSRFEVKIREAFGASLQEGGLTVYSHNEEKTVLKIFGESSLPIEVTLKHYSTKEFSWEMNTTDNYRFIIEGLNPVFKYKLIIQGKPVCMEGGQDGQKSFTYPGKGRVRFRLYSK